MPSRAYAKRPWRASPPPQQQQAQQTRRSPLTQYQTIENNHKRPPYTRAPWRSEISSARNDCLLIVLTRLLSLLLLLLRGGPTREILSRRQQRWVALAVRKKSGSTVAQKMVLLVGILGISQTYEGTRWSNSHCTVSIGCRRWWTWLWKVDSREKLGHAPI